MKRFVLHPDDTRQQVAENLRRYVSELPDNKAWRIEITEYRKTRSDKQRRSLFGVAYDAIMEQTGLSGEREKQQLHNNMCMSFFGAKQTKLRGTVPIRTTTTNEAGERDEIDVQTAMRMYEHIQRLCAEYGIQVPDPEIQDVQ